MQLFSLSQLVCFINSEVRNQDMRGGVYKICIHRAYSAISHPSLYVKNLIKTLIVCVIMGGCGPGCTNSLH